MELVCPGCKKTIGFKRPLENKVVTHSYCTKHAIELFKQFGWLAEYNIKKRHDRFLGNMDKVSRVQIITKKKESVVNA